MPRPRRQDARRRLMVDAAARAIAGRGVANVRIKDIADEAGMSPGSVLYYFPELDDLIFEVHRTAVDRFYQHRLTRVDACPDPLDKLAAAIDSGVPTGADDPDAALLYELHHLSTRSSAHAALMSSLHDREVALYAGILELGAATGRFSLVGRPREVAESLVIAEDGLGLHIISRNPSVTAESARTLVRHLAAMLAPSGAPKAAEAAGRAHRSAAG